MTCGFCSSCGIEGPHDHTLRCYKTKEVLCPRLKATECQYCRNTGHTQLYCPKRKEESNYYDEKANEITDTTLTINVNPPRPKRDRQYDSNGFQPVRGSSSKKRLVNTSVTSMNNFLTSSFAALEIEEVESNQPNITPSPDIEEQLSEMKLEVTPVKSEWVNIVKNGKKLASSCVAASQSETKISRNKSETTKQEKIQMLREKLGRQNLREDLARWCDTDDDEDY